MITVWTGLTTGALWALVATTYNLILASSGILNFAQGALAMFGGFVGYVAVENWGLPIIPALLIAVGVGLGMGALSLLLSVAPLTWATQRGGRGSTELITTVGFSSALIGLAEVVWGTDPLKISATGESTIWHIFGGAVGPWQLILIGLAIVAAVIAHLWMTRTRSGLSALAMAEDRDAATARGVNARKLMLGSFVAAGGLAGLLGVVMVPTTFAYPDLGNTLALSGFVAVAIGGLGAQMGSLVGGFAIGLVGSFATRYLSASWSDICVFGVLLLVLLVRPGGIGGQLEVRRV